MTNDLQRIQDIGHRQEDEFGVSIIDGSNLPIQLGIHDVSVGKMPSKIIEILQTTTGISYDPIIVEIVKESVLGQHSYVPTDGIMWHYANGDTSYGIVSEGRNIKSVDPITSTSDGDDLPSFSVRYYTGNGISASHNMEALGSKIQQLSWALDLSSVDNWLTETVVYIGKELANAGATRRIPIYADTNDLSGQKPFSPKYGFEVFWDSIDISKYVLQIAFTQMNVLKIRFVDGSLKPQFITLGRRQQGITFQMLRRDITKVFNDYLGQTPLDTFKSMTVKIYNQDGDYRKFYLNDVTLNKCELNFAILQKKEDPMYIVEGVVQTSYSEHYDAVDDTLYGGP